MKKKLLLILLGILAVDSGYLPAPAWWPTPVVVKEDWNGLGVLSARLGRGRASDRELTLLAGVYRDAAGQLGGNTAGIEGVQRRIIERCTGQLSDQCKPISDGLDKALDELSMANKLVTAEDYANAYRAISLGFEAAAK